jgi:hypothetical protein
MRVDADDTACAHCRSSPTGARPDHQRRPQPRTTDARCADPGDRCAAARPDAGRAQGRAARGDRLELQGDRPPAEPLFSTVDHQLRSVREKLGVRSAGQLVRVLAAHATASASARPPNEAAGM